MFQLFNLIVIAVLELTAVFCLSIESVSKESIGVGTVFSFAFFGLLLVYILIVIVSNPRHHCPPSA
jgi:hypothetical protein